MPKTRNINRTQWSAANSSVVAPKSGASRKHRNGTGISQDEEKENIGKQTTETRTHRRRSTVLGPSTVGKTSTNGKVASKRKTTTLREKKMPLQDITSQFLPTAESANRGVDSGDQREGSIYGDSTNRVLATVPSPEASPLRPHVVASPLPPSSPPSEPTSSPVKFSYPMDKLNLGERSESHYLYEQWSNFDDPQTALPQEYSTPIQSNSDPFGFTAVERKLKQEREIAAVLAEPDHEALQNIYEDLDDIPVADTSSPRPVRRIKRRRGHSNQRCSPSESEENHPAVVLPIALSYPSYCTPPTPHKDRQKHRRLSHPGHDVFSPCSSSVESSPSPTKASSSKRRRTVHSGHDPLDEFNEEAEKSCISDVALDKLPLPKRQRKVGILAVQEQGHQDAVARNLRPRTRAAVSHTADETHTEPPKRKKPSTSKNQKNLPSKSQPSKKTAAENNENGKIDEKWQRERDERIEYFKRLSEYKVEEENVYFI